MSRNQCRRSRLKIRQTTLRQKPFHASGFCHLSRPNSLLYGFSWMWFWSLSVSTRWRKNFHPCMVPITHFAPLLSPLYMAWMAFKIIRFSPSPSKGPYLLTLIRNLLVIDSHICIQSDFSHRVADL
jgi:hypothetical protein